MWHVYIVQCADRSLYTGVAVDVGRRVEEHRAGRGSRYLRSKLPIKLVYQESHSGKSQALKREAQIKRWTHRQKKELILDTLPMKHVTTRQMREIDRRASEIFGIPSILLTENASRTVAEEVWKIKPRKVLLFCGSGNNGGDGFVAARHLVNRTVPCAVIYFQKPTKADPAMNFKILEKMKVPLLLWQQLTKARRQALMRRADAVVDAIFRIGISRDVEEPYKTAIEEMNRSERPVVSVDIPSGMNADTGKPMGVCVRAQRTVTLALPKLAFRHKASRAYTGKVIVADISIPIELVMLMIRGGITLARKR